MELLLVYLMAHWSAHPPCKYIRLGLQLNLEPDNSNHKWSFDPSEHIANEWSISELLDSVHLEFSAEMQWNPFLFFHCWGSLLGRPTLKLSVLVKILVMLKLWSPMLRVALQAKSWTSRNSFTTIHGASVFLWSWAAPSFFFSAEDFSHGSPQASSPCAFSLVLLWYALFLDLWTPQSALLSQLLYQLAWDF